MVVINEIVVLVNEVADLMNGDISPTFETHGPESGYLLDLTGEAAVLIDGGPLHCAEHR